MTPCTVVDGSGEICCIPIQGIQYFTVNTEISDTYFRKVGNELPDYTAIAVQFNVIISSESIIKVTKSITIKLVRCVARRGRWRVHKQFQSEITEDANLKG